MIARYHRSILTPALLALASLAGCGRSTPPTPSGNAAAAGEQTLSALVGRQTWDVFYVGDARIGYGFTAWRADDRQPERIVGDSTLRLGVKRFGDDAQSEISMSVVQSADGQVESIAGTARLGNSPTTVTGQVDGDTLRIETESSGQTFRTTLPWTSDCRGYFAMEESLLLRPMKPGEQRRIRTLMPVFNQLADIELRAVATESTKLLDATRELLRIDTTTSMTGSPPIEATLWADASGEVLKSFTSALNQVSYRVTKAQATADTGVAQLDIGISAVVPLAGKFGNLHEANVARYRVRLDGADPAKLFVGDLAQQVTADDDRTATIVVRAIRPDQPVAGTFDAQKGPTAADREPNALVQSDHARVKSMAGEVAADETDAWRVAVALEKLVHDRVATKNFSQTLSSAAETAESLEGDCTEHAALLAALARARGIPARAVIGLVYMPAQKALGFHMWTEVYIRDRWIAIDGTLGRGGIGAGHLKLATTSLDEGNAFASFLPVAQVLGKLTVEVVEP